MTEQNHDKVANTHDSATLNLLHRVIDEGIRQAKLSANQAYWSFSSAMLMATASALVGLGGASLILLDHSSEGSVTAAIGLASGVYSYQLSKEAGERQKQANERLDQMLIQLKQDNEN
jgi:hypothetical protein